MDGPTTPVPELNIRSRLRKRTNGGHLTYLVSRQSAHEVSQTSAPARNQATPAEAINSPCWKGPQKLERGRLSQWRGDPTREEGTEGSSNKVHFKKVWIENVSEVRVGDFVEVDTNEPKEDGQHHRWVGQVIDLFQIELGGRYFRAYWFYKARDTFLKVQPRRAPCLDPAPSTPPTKRPRHCAPTPPCSDFEVVLDSGPESDSHGGASQLPGLMADSEIVDDSEESELSEDESSDDEFEHPATPFSMDAARIFRASERDAKGYENDPPLELGVIRRVVKVQQVPPGGDPDMSGRYQYWWDQEHDRDFYSFHDPPGSESLPASGETLPASEPPAETQAGSSGEQLLRELRILDLFSGCGGMAFTESSSQGVRVKSCWAVDDDYGACRSFQCNHPHVKVFPDKVEHLLALAKVLKALSDKYPDDWAPSDDDEDAASADEGSAGETAPACSSGQGSGSEYEVAEIRSIEHATAGGDAREVPECLFEVVWKGKGRDSRQWPTTWEPLSELTHCEEKLAEFVMRWRAAPSTGRIPLPGEVDVIQGGPPCQGVSGFNRMARQRAILEEERNRQLEIFLDAIAFFQPRFVLMENVLDIARKEDGMYAKWAAARLVVLRYQIRLGVLAAAQYGAPQGRFRIFLWGAKAGQEQLPAFPEPTHAAKHFRHHVPKSLRGCVVDYQTEEARKQAYPQAYVGDALSDLPPVSNFGIAERHEYASSAQRPYQLWLRRRPPPNQASAEERAAAADKFLDAAVQDRLTHLKMLAKGKNGLIKLGSEFLCAEAIRLVPSSPAPSPSGQPPQPQQWVGVRPARVSGQGAYLEEVWRAVLEKLQPAERQRVLGELHDSKLGLAQLLGEEVASQMRLAETASGPLRDHRPFCFHADDWCRIKLVPKQPLANFRQLPGLATNAKGTFCAGHVHAPRDSAGRTGCPGGGTMQWRARGTLRNDANGWRGAALPGCPSRTAFLPSGGLMVPRWNGALPRYRKMAGRVGGGGGAFSRVWHDEVVSTVIAKRQSLHAAWLHPEQDRVLTIRETSRLQGFPDYFVFAGADIHSQATHLNGSVIISRYSQIGNAVCPLVAAALGRCLALAAAGKSPPGAAVVPVPDPEYDQCMAEARELGLRWYAEEHGHPAGAEDLHYCLRRNA